MLSALSHNAMRLLRVRQINSRKTYSINFEPLSSMAADPIFEELLVRLHKLAQMQEYDCFSWTKVRGGTTNLIYRGTLQQPLKKDVGGEGDRPGTIILKHATVHVPGNKDFWLDVNRCVRYSRHFDVVSVEVWI